MNKPVAWISRLPEGDVYNCAWAEKQNDDDIPLYTHPVKEQSNLVKVVQDHVKDLKRCVKVFRTQLLNNTADEMEVAIKELENAIEAHPVKELTDEEIMEIVADKYEKGHGRYIDTKLFFVEFAKAILRKAQEK